MHRAVGTCGKCGGTVYVNRNGKPGVCETCGAIEKVKAPKPNLPKLEMQESDSKQLLLS